MKTNKDKLKYLITLLLLTSCAIKPKDSILYDLECQDHIQDGYIRGREDAFRIMKEHLDDNIAYGARVKFIKGFYRGQTGQVVAQNATQNELIVKMDNRHIKDQMTYPYFLELIPRDKGE